MLAYAASRPTIAARRSSPQSLLLIASAHVVAIAVLVSAKMDLPTRIIEPTQIIDLIQPKAAAVPPTPAPTGDPLPYRPTVTDRALPLPRVAEPTVPDPGPAAGPLDPGPAADPLPPLPRLAIGGWTGPSLLTPEGELKPPYPRHKLILEEEASLTLRLSIDERGRVVAVEPLGRADRVFLEAARRHLIAHWRYKPATENGRAVASTVTTTLHFRLDG